MLALILAAALGQTPPPSATVARPSVITQPDWLQRPVAEDMANYYPKAAAAANVEGDATISCRVTAEGLLADCQVTAENPPGRGFGEAAVGLATRFKMRPMTRNGVPVDGGKINIPIRFRLPRQGPSLTMATRCYGFAAAAAEREPESQDRQIMVGAWRMALDAMSVRERQRPSEFEQMLTELRKTGAARLDDPAAKADRDESDRAIAGPGLEQLRAVARQ